MQQTYSCCMSMPPSHHTQCPHQAGVELLDRIRVSSQLREHQLWHAADLLSFDARSGATGRRFSELMAGNALVEASLLLALVQSPSRQLSTLQRRDDGWVCHLTYAQAKRTKRATGQHPDLAAAVLTATIRSLLAPPTAPISSTREIQPCGM